MRCVSCNLELQLDAFYAGRKSCKECVKSKVRAYRSSNLERCKAYDRGRANLPHRIEARAEYQKSEAYKSGRPRVIARYQETHPLRRQANIAVGNALRDGRLLRQPCFVCGDKAEAHHPDYSAPLAVAWNCVKHHNQLHLEHREAQRQNHEN